MSATIPPETPAAPKRRSFLLARIGLVLAGLLALGDIQTSVSQLPDDPVVPGVLIAICVISLVAIPFAWLGAKWARNVVVVVRVLAALSAVPAFIAPGIPAGWIMMAAAGIILSLVAVVLLLVTPKEAR